MTSVNISRNLFGGMCAALAILSLLVAYLFMKAPPAEPAEPKVVPTELILDDLGIKVPTELANDLRAKGFTDLMLLHKDAGVQILGLDSTVLKPCGVILGTKILDIPGAPSCRIKGVTLTSLNHIHIYQFSHSPGTTCKQVGRKLICY